MKTTWKKPNTDSLSDYQKEIIALVPEGKLPATMKRNTSIMVNLLKGLPKSKLSYRYAKGKWTIPEIITHLIDTERVFAYRILTISRGDTTPLPGFDENDFIKGIDVSKFDFKDILEEFKTVRKSTLYLLNHLTEEMYLKKGVANNTEISVQSIAYFLAGHEVHHRNVIKDKYLL